MASLIQDAQTERRRKFIIDVAYLLIIIAIFILFLKYAFYPLLPIEIAVLVALILHKPVEKLASKAKIPKGVTATVIVILALALIAAGFYFLVLKIVQEIGTFVQFIQVKIQDYDRPVRWQACVLQSVLRYTSVRFLCLQLNKG